MDDNFDMPVPPPFGRRRGRWGEHEMAGPPWAGGGRGPRRGPGRHFGPGPGPGPMPGFGAPWEQWWMGRGGRGPRRGPRAGRGDVRAAIIALLAEQPMHGYQIISELSDRSGGVWRASPGSVYPTLAQLEDEGLVTASQQDGKRVFSLTDAGRAAAASRDDGPAPWDTFDAPSHGRELHRLAMSTGAAVMQVAQIGRDDQIQEACAILADARRRLYRLLADEPNDDAVDPNDDE